MARASNPDTADWVEEKILRQNYKLLQFFDTLALYFNIRHESERGVEVYVHVPKNEDEDATVTLTPKGDGVYHLDPFPFAGDRLEVACGGRYVSPVSDEDIPDGMGAMLRALPTDAQTHIFVAA